MRSSSPFCCLRCFANFTGIPNLRRSPKCSIPPVAPTPTGDLTECSLNGNSRRSFSFVLRKQMTCEADSTDAAPAIPPVFFAVQCSQPRAGSALSWLRRSVVCRNVLCCLDVLRVESVRGVRGQLVSRMVAVYRLRCAKMSRARRTKVKAGQNLCSEFEVLACAMRP
jgi:hypothetical protein